MTFMNQHGDYRAQIDFQISRIEPFSAPQIDVVKPRSYRKPFARSV